jgi:hypothetical protein
MRLTFGKNEKSELAGIILFALLCFCIGLAIGRVLVLIGWWDWLKAIL